MVLSDCLSCFHDAQPPFRDQSGISYGSGELPHRHRSVVNARAEAGPAKTRCLGPEQRSGHFPDYYIVGRVAIWAGSGAGRTQGKSCWLAAEIRRKLAPATEELTEPVLVRWKEPLAELKVKNRTMTCEDSLIAATALQQGHIVATHNKRHFEPSGVQTFDRLASDSPRVI